MIAKAYMNYGLTRDTVLEITGLTKHELYYQSKGKRRGKQPTQTTKWKDHTTQQIIERPNEELVNAMIEILSNPDLPNWYRTVTTTLQVKGWYVNHKKVYRLSKENGLLSKPRKKAGRTFVKFRRVTPLGALQILEMDIKYCWIEGKKKYAFILTVIDTFTRYVLHWSAGYHMRQEQVKQVWEYIIVHYLQPADLLNRSIEVEVRNDNGKQFCAQMVQSYFTENHLNQVFTHPYSPEENGHIESFHKILGRSLKNNYFSNLESLNNRLEIFYETYNNKRHHGSIAGLSPSQFWALWESEMITMKVYEKKKATFKLKVPYQEVLNVENLDKYVYRGKEARRHFRIDSIESK